jgi:PhnB protein
MPAPEPYLHFPGTAKEALTFYHGIFGGELILNTYGDFNRDDGPADAIAHGMVRGPVSMFASDTAPGQAAFQSSGLMFSLLGTSDPGTLRTWFARLAEGGTVIDDLQVRPWGATDGQVVDRYGLHWLVGFEKDE